MYYSIARQGIPSNARGVKAGMTELDDHLFSQPYNILCRLDCMSIRPDKLDVQLFHSIKLKEVGKGPLLYVCRSLSMLYYSIMYTSATCMYMRIHGRECALISQN